MAKKLADYPQPKKVSPKYLEALKAPRATIRVLGYGGYGKETPLVTFLRARLLVRTDLRDSGTWTSIRSDDPLVKDSDNDDLYRGILDLESCDIQLHFFPNLTIIGYSDEGVKIRQNCKDGDFQPMKTLSPKGVLIDEDRYILGAGTYLKYRVDLHVN